MNTDQLLDRHYLEVRARLLEIAATLDRIDRGTGSAENDARLQQIREGIEILLSTDDAGAASKRAERIQHLFSRPYEANWRTSLDV